MHNHSRDIVIPLNIEARPGQRVLVPVYATQTLGLYGLKLMLAFDSKLVAASNASRSPLTESWELLDAARPGSYIAMAWMPSANPRAHPDVPGRGLPAGSGPLLYIPFAVPAGTKAGTIIPLSITPFDDDPHLELRFISGSLKVIA